MALGSSLAVGAHLLPIIDPTSVSQAIELTKSKEAFLATSGAKRMLSQARRSERCRRLLLDGGAMSVLAVNMERGEENVRDAALEALAGLAVEGVEHFVWGRGLREALGSDVCHGGCESVWKVIGREGMEMWERQEALKQFIEEDDAEMKRSETIE